MVNEEIVTALKNAVEHGESLSDAMQIMMNSGYNPAEVQEASRYISGGALHMQQSMPEEHLAMPEQKSAMQKMAFWKSKKSAPLIVKQPVQQSIQQNKFQQQKPPIQQPIQQSKFQQQVQKQIQPLPPETQILNPSFNKSSSPLTRQLEKIGPRKPSHIKEIILLIILLILIGLLVATIFFKDTILAWFA